jgi:ATP-binding cassette subfamily C protein
LADSTLVDSASQANRGRNGILLMAFVLSFFVNILRLSGPLFMILVFDRVLPARSEETLVALFAMVATFLLAQAVIDYARRRILARFGAQFQERLEVRLLAHAGQGDLFEQGRSKPVAGLDEVDGLRGFFHSTSLIAIYDFFWTPLFLFVIFVIDPLLGWICVGAMALILSFMLVRTAFIGTRETDAAAAKRELGDLKTMIAASRETIRSQEMARGFKERWLAARRASRDRAIALKDWTVWFDSVSDISVRLARYSVLAVGAWLTLQGSLSTGAMVAATFLVYRALLPVEKFMTELPRIADAWRNWGQLKRLLAGKSTEKADPVVVDGSNARTRLSLVHVAVRSSFTGASILKGITLAIEPGQMVQIVGMTGGGKTALAESIMGLWRLSGGRILVNGLNIAQLNDAETERLFGYVPESPGFIAGTLAENISHLDREASLDRVAGAARRACLHAMISSLPEGYLSLIDPAGRPLSRGQRHQLALARAVYYMPKLLIVDAPDSVLLEVIPKTVEKTFGQLTKEGGSILILSRKKWPLKQISATYQIDDGRLKPLETATAPPTKITVLSETMPKARAPTDKSMTTLIRS